MPPPAITAFFFLLENPLAERVFAFYPFTPNSMPDNWRELLRYWLLGEPLAGLAFGQESETLHFIEGGLVYRLPWAMEACVCERRQTAM